MFAAIALATCLGLGLSVGLVSQPANHENPDLPAQVERLLKQLDDRERAKREDAEKQLVALGPDILSLLPEPNNRMAAELRQRLARITKALEEAEAVSTLEGTHVTLVGEMPLDQALDAITEQTGNQIDGYSGVDATVKTDFQNVPFWQAMDQLLDQSTMTTDAFGGQPNTLVLTARASSQTSRTEYVDYEGPFRVDALRVFSVRDLRNPEMNGMRVSTTLAWEPRLTPISVSHSFDSAKATDEQGNEIPIGMERGGREATIQPGMTGIDIEIPFQLTDRSITKIASLKGEFNVLVPGESEEFIFDADPGDDGKFARGMQQKRAGVTVVLENVRKNVELFQVLVRVRFDEADGALESHRTWIYANEAYLLNPEGERIENAGVESTGQRQNEVSVAYLFALPEGQKDLKNCKFVYKSPTKILRQSVAYELKDIPLP